MYPNFLQNKNYLVYQFDWKFESLVNLFPIMDNYNEPHFKDKPIKG